MGYSKKDLAGVADRAIAWDDNVSGLGLRRVDTRRGVTWSWVVDYRVDGKRRRMVLGRYPDIAVDDARTLARRRIGEAATDRDPLAELRGTTVAELLSQYETHHRTRRHHQPPRHDRDTAARLDLLRARWGSRPAARVTYRDVAALLADVCGPVAQNRMRALVRGIWNRGRAWGLVPATTANPAEGTRANPERRKTLRAITAEEVGRVIASAESRGLPGLVIVLVALTGARPSEALALRWSDVEVERGTVTLRGRSGERKGGGTLELQIGPALAWVFERAAAAGQGGDRVFPGRGGRPMSSSTIADVFAAIVVDAELPADATVGGLRAAVATSLAASAGLKVAAAMLGHADERTTLRYVRPSVDDRTNAAIAWTSAIAAAALKKTPTDP